MKTKTPVFHISFEIFLISFDDNVLHIFFKKRNHCQQSLQLKNEHCKINMHFILLKRMHFKKYIIDNIQGDKKKTDVACKIVYFLQ